MVSAVNALACYRLKEDIPAEKQFTPDKWTTISDMMEGMAYAEMLSYELIMS